LADATVSFDARQGCSEMNLRLFTHQFFKAVACRM
jgi:hypothetical protein